MSREVAALPFQAHANYGTIDFFIIDPIECQLYFSEMTNEIISSPEDSESVLRAILDVNSLVAGTKH